MVLGPFERVDLREVRLAEEAEVVAAGLLALRVRDGRKLADVTALEGFLGFLTSDLRTVFLVTLCNRLGRIMLIDKPRGVAVEV